MTAIDLNTLGVVGGGTMGAGIAQVAVQSGAAVVLVEQTDDRARTARSRIDAALAKLAGRGKITETARAEAMDRLTVTTAYADLAGADVVVEAVFEELGAKLEVARAVAAIVGPDTLFASNTSSISMDRIADGFPRPELVVGIHFFNPVPVLPLVEVVAGERTSAETVERATALATRLGKTPILVKDRPGFVVNRLLIPMINEAALLAGEGVATYEDVDTAMRLGASHPLGPLALGDLIGLDVCLAIMRTLAADLDAVRFAPAPLLQRLVAEGKLGRKTGGGFFAYDK